MRDARRTGNGKELLAKATRRVFEEQVRPLGAKPATDVAEKPAGITERLPKSE